MEPDKELKSDLSELLAKIDDENELSGVKVIPFYNRVFKQCTPIKGKARSRDGEMYEMAVELIEKVKQDFASEKCSENVAKHRLTVISKIFMYLDRFYCPRYQHPTLQKLCATTASDVIGETVTPQTTTKRGKVKEDKELKSDFLDFLATIDENNGFTRHDYMSFYNRVFLQCSTKSDIESRDGEMYALAVECIDGVKQDLKDGKCVEGTAQRRLKTIHDVFMYLDRFYCVRHERPKLCKLCATTS